MGASNVEDILQNILDGTTEYKKPYSRVEILLVQIKDLIAQLQSAVNLKGETTTPLTDNATTNPIEIDGQSYTAVMNDAVIYQSGEFIFDGTKWHELGDLSNLTSLNIGAMTGYTKASTGSAIATTDTLNQAIGKVEKRVDVNENNILLNTADIADSYNSDSIIIRKLNSSQYAWENAIPNATTGVVAPSDTRICTRKIDVGNMSTITVEFNSDYKVAWYLYDGDNFYNKKYWITTSPCTINTAGATHLILGFAKADDSAISPSAISNISAITPVSLSTTQNYNGTSIHFEIGSLMSQNGLPMASTNRIRSDQIFLPKGTIINYRKAPNSLIVYEYEKNKDTLRSYSNWGDGDSYVMSDDGYCRILVRKDSTNPTISDSEVTALSSFVTVITAFPMEILDNYYYGDYTPNYYNIATKSAAIDSNMYAAGVNGFTFAFCTDLHWEVNWRRIPSLLSHIKNSNKVVEYMLVGGDLIDGGVKAQAVSNMTDCIDNLYRAGFTPLCVRGNHDNNSIPSGNTLISDSEFYAICQSRCPNSAVYGDYAYFYYDDTKTKTRFICLDSGTEGTPLSSAQSAWLSDVLQSTPNGWHIIAAWHIVYDLASGSWQSVPLDLAPTAFSTAVFTILDTHNSNADSKVEAIFGGHVHSDHNYETTGGIPIVLTDTASSRALDGGTATRFTDTETVLDVITVDYENSQINCVRIGRGNDRSISY